MPYSPAESSYGSGRTTIPGFRSGESIRRTWRRIEGCEGVQNESRALDKVAPYAFGIRRPERPSISSRVRVRKGKLVGPIGAGIGFSCASPRIQGRFYTPLACVWKNRVQARLELLIPTPDVLHLYARQSGHVDGTQHLVGVLVDLDEFGVDGGFVRNVIHSPLPLLFL